MFSGNPSGAVLSSVSQLDVLNVKNSLKMLTAVDGALVRIDLERSDLGATCLGWNIPLITYQTLL